MTCGDGVKGGSEQCDNGNQTGCKTGCVPDIGYTCTGAIGVASVCAITCGDGVKGVDEQCDNGNKIGCQTGCKFDAGYSCSGAFGQPSVCFSNICGDSILGNG